MTGDKSSPSRERASKRYFLGQLESARRDASNVLDEVGVEGQVIVDPERGTVTMIPNTRPDGEAIVQSRGEK